VEDCDVPGLSVMKHVVAMKLARHGQIMQATVTQHVVNQLSAGCI
jgi:hypothetical protein